jgi:dTDP-4-amino-4,6-dideoxygalactose transaminase
MPSTVQQAEPTVEKQPNGGTSTSSTSSALPAFDFLDLKAQFATIREAVLSAAAKVLESQHFILGDEVRLFEQEVNAALGSQFAISCASGTDALTLAMLAAEIGPGDEVITTPFSFIATAGSIAWVGARPVFVDIDPLSFNIDIAAIETAITPRTRAIMPVHLFGLPADLAPIVRLAELRRIAVIEDAAQAIAARYKDRMVGTIGTFGCFSFFPSKNLGGAGDGGLITTHDAALADRLRLLRVHGSKKKYHHDVLGTNSRLDALQAAILRVKLQYLDRWTLGRQARANHYRALFAAYNLADFVQPPRVSVPEFSHVYNQFTIRCTRRDELREFLKRAGIPTEVYYPLPLHLQPAFADLGYREGQFPQAEQASREVLSLPVYPELQESQQEFVVKTISEFYARTRTTNDQQIAVPYSTAAA